MVDYLAQRETIARTLLLANIPWPGRGVACHANGFACTKGRAHKGGFNGSQ
jgi:hypothetical protein